ncbi:MAG: DUF262 domain-containing protein [Candidatus Omnitrophota bacterium]|nr:DUF262 domain-containing protein [Candidatus Omnitrophota bacterium]
MGTKIRKYNLKELVRFIESKHVAVPEFQRGFVWKTGQVKKLFDSLIKQYPVGSFILWETNKHIDARTLDGEKLPQRKFLILDGQQRMASIYYLCRQKKFVEPRVKDKFHETCDNRERQVIDFEKFYIDRNKKGPVLEYARESSCELDFNKFSRLVRNSYRVPVITISLNDYHHAIEVFERINQAGTRISTESIFLSETWNQHSNIGKILRTWKRQNREALTSGIDTVIFIHVFAIILQLEKRKQQTVEIGITTLKKIAEEVHQHTSNTYNKIFKDVVDSVARAVTHLKEEYEIVSLSDLPSQTMITILAVFSYYRKRAPTKKQATELRKWFWRSSLSNRYIGSGYSQHIGMDAKKMRDLAEHNRDLKISPADIKIFAKVKGVDIRAGRSTYRNIIKQALWQQTPIFINGKKISRDDVESGQHKPEDDHFFPYDLYRKGISGQEINNILNIHFLNGDENSRKKNRLPSEWLQEQIDDIGANASIVEKYFSSQLLPFRNLKDLRRYERAFKEKGMRAKQSKFARSYQSFLWRRFKLFEKTLNRLQNGRLK